MRKNALQNALGKLKIDDLTHSSYYQFIYSYLMNIYSRCKISASVFYFCIKIKKKNSAKPVHPSNH